jgi:ribonuclease HI
MHSITSVETNVKWNGARGNFFRPQRGIRQGDPISPYLFVMCIDKLSHLIIQAVNEGKWKAPKAGKHGPIVSHLMFADDLLLFGEATEEQMRCMVYILDKFCSLSGQQVSKEKTSIFFSSNTNRNLRDKLVRISGFRETNALGKYLGVPLIGRAPKKKDFDYVIDQVNSKLMHWKANQLSFAGRVTLAKSVLEAIPIYPMMTNIIPKACIDEIHRIQRKFIWGDTDQARRYHAVGWDMVSRPKQIGGLGLRRLNIMNTACILKLGRKIQRGVQDFWCEVLVGKYKRGMVDGMAVAKSSDSHLWKSIAKVWPYLDTYSWWTIGDGKTIDLCHDAWIEDGLRLEDCNLQIPEQLRGAKLIDIVNNGDWNWDELNTWIPNSITAKITALLPPNESNGNDQQVCKEDASGSFSIAEMYHVLCDFNMTENFSVWQSIWKLKVPERVRAFIWIVKHDRLLTNVRKHRMGLGMSQCNYCRDQAETTLHVLRDCALIQPFWISVVNYSFRYQFFSSSLQDWIAMNVSNVGGNNSNNNWSSFWAIACHLAWTWRNKENHNEDFIRPIKPHEVVRQRIASYMLADKALRVEKPQQQIIVQVGWTPPDVGWVCLNVDGSCKDGVIGCGGVIRGNEGEWLHGFSKLIGRGDVYIAELWGVFEGLKLAKRMNFDKVEVRIDARVVLEDIVHKKASNICGKTLVGRICQLMEHEWEVVFKHSYREANYLADALAKNSFIVMDDACFFSDCPDFCKHLFDADEKGFTTPRRVFV